MSETRWGAVIRGEARDLEDWISVLKEPFDPWVEIHGNDTVLRSRAFDELPSAGEVRVHAFAQIQRLNGAMAVSQGAGPVEFDDIVVEFSPDGNRRRLLFGAVTASARSRASAEGIVLGPDGKPRPAPPAAPSDVQNWIPLSDADGLLEDALIYFGRAAKEGWFDMYKTLECLFLKFGGESAFLKLNWAPPATVELLKRTANWARHARQKFDPPPNPMPFSEARQLMAQLLRRAFEEAGRRPPGA